MLVKNDVRCNWCGWEGYEDELALIVDLSDDGISHWEEYEDDLDLSDDGISNDVHFIKVCPGCKQDDYLMDIDNDNPAEN